MRVLFLFLDGIGLGVDDSRINPFAKVALPNLQGLLAGNKLLQKTISANSSNGTRFDTTRATLLSLDAELGVEGLPQSATGQAALLTGINVSAEIGYHYGPKPNQEVAEYLRNGNLFSSLMESGYRSALLNAYPPAYFSAIESGRRLYSAIPLAVISAGILPDTPVMSSIQAGERMAELAGNYDLALFEYWLSDYAGHSQDMQAAKNLLLTFDQVLGGLLGSWNDQEGLILITSDHGNLEDLSTRRHTANPVPALIIGDQKFRDEFAEGLFDITNVASAITRLISQEKIL
jgi:hypothetical protein